MADSTLLPRPSADTAVTPYSPLGHRPWLDAELARAQGCEPKHPEHGELRLGDPRKARFCENDGHWIDCDEPADQFRCPCCEESWT